MRDVFNFNAGPAMIPEPVLRKAQAEMLDWQGSGISIMEIGHRSAEFKIVADEAEKDLRDLMAIPENYKVLFLSGGASTQFAMVPLNLFSRGKRADYFDTGVWSKKAIGEAKYYGDVNIAAKTEYQDDIAYLPDPALWELHSDAAYVHYTPNETIDGIQFKAVPKTGDVPLVADMTSMILSEPVNVSDFGIIYAGAQKNVGFAGLNIVIIRDDLIEKALPLVPSLFTYKLHADHQSFYNTPPTYNWYMAGLIFKWMKELGGVAAMYEINKRKAAKLYEAIDAYPTFYVSRVRPDFRSIMNVMFYLQDDKLTPVFLEAAAKLGLVNLRGHRVSGGVRASIYNAMPEEGVDALVKFMHEFVRQNG